MNGDETTADPARDEDEVVVVPAGDLGWPVIASRVVAAIFGGYLLSYTFVAAVVRFSPLSNVDTVLVSTVAGVLIYVGTIVWVFGAKSSTKVWLVLLALSAILFVVAKI
jgi:hypothetical protein